MSIARIAAIVAVVGLVVFGISFLHGAAKYRRQTLWMDRMAGQFHSIQGLGTKRPVLSEPLGGGAPGRYAAVAVGKDLMVIRETEVHRESDKAPRQSLRQYVLLRKNDFGGWDLCGSAETTAELDKHPDPVAAGEKLAEASGEAAVVADYFLPVRDNFALEAARAALRGTKGWEMLMGDELAKTPDDPALLLAAITAEAAAGNVEGLEARLDAMEKLPNYSGRAVLVETVAKCRKWLEARKAGSTEEFGKAAATAEGE